MKGATGLIVAAFLGLLAVVLNWVYLEQKTRDVDSVAFIGVRDGATIQPGELILGKHLVEVRIPARHARNLKDFVYLYQDLDTVTGIPASRTFRGGELFFRDDYVTPATELELEDGEMVFWVTVDSRSVVPELINPGDRISFHFPLFTVDATGGGNAPRAGNNEIEEVGPFRVKSLGNRLGSVEVMRAGRRAPAQEQKIGIVIDKQNAEEMEQFKKIQGQIMRNNLRNITVTLHADG